MSVLHWRDLLNMFSATHNSLATDHGAMRTQRPGAQGQDSGHQPDAPATAVDGQLAVQPSSHAHASVNFAALEI